MTADRCGSCISQHAVLQQSQSSLIHAFDAAEKMHEYRSRSCTTPALSQPTLECLTITAKTCSPRGEGNVFDIDNVLPAQQPMYAEIVELKLGDGSIRRGQVQISVCTTEDILALGFVLSLLYAYQRS